MYGFRIRQLRERLGYTQEFLAERTDVAVGQVNRWENDKATPNGEKVALIASALSTSADYLLGLTDDPVPAHMRGGSFRPQEIAVIDAWRRGDKIQAIKVIASDE